MTYSRRKLGLLLPALAAASANAQSTADKSLEKLPRLGTKAYIFNDLEVTTNGKNRARAMFTGKTHTGFKLESHSSDIAPGEVNHPPHQHLREEMMLIRQLHGPFTNQHHLFAKVLVRRVGHFARRDLALV